MSLVDDLRVHDVVAAVPHRGVVGVRGVVVLRWWDEKGNATVTTQRAPRADTAATIPTGSTR